MKKIITRLAGFARVNRFGKIMGMKLEIKKPGDIIYRMKVTQSHESSPKTAHGGVVSALMDSVLGVAALTYAMKHDEYCSTVEFKMNFIAPAFVGDELIGYGKLDHAGKSLLFTSATIVNKKGELIAKGLGTFNRYPMHKKQMRA
ncbi:MAG: PaaI family thioesterase [Xanthomonadaceae bacterium]|nr:PaaI family thioesterase [Xanthomonadaceae bacterium]